MKILILFIFCMLLPRGTPQRRQFMSYANNIVHPNPNYPDQAAQSSVQFKLNSNPEEPRQLYHPQQSYIKSPSDSQLFNVGYSVSFTNKTPKIPRKVNLDDGEIITGTRKENEEVQVPQEFSSPVYTTKKQKIGGIKPQKPSGTYPNPKFLLNQANLSPNTQKYYRALEQVKPQIQNPQELEKYSWRNLSPGVEIIRSTEVPIRKENFDHERALGRGQEFDFSNAVEANQPVFYGKRAYPLDTSLIKEPVQVDTRLLKEASNNEAQYQPYRTIPLDFNPAYQNFQTYGKPPQPPIFNPEEAFKRQPRYLHDLNRGLRPPRFEPHPYQRIVRIA